MSNNLQLATQVIYNAEPQFNAVSCFSEKEKNAFQREAMFASQQLSKNNFLLKTAINNQESLFNAIVNIGSIGISLNPAEKEAYLVPRDGAVCLDISYMGLMRLATDTGQVQWVQSNIVHTSDSFKITGLDSQPIHEYNYFDPNRGAPVGVYVTAKLASGDYLTGAMSVAEINAIRDKSQGHMAFVNGRAKSSIWNDNWGEMAKKTVVKRESKYWPKSERLNHAIHYLNQNGEGFEAIESVAAEEKKLTGIQAQSIHSLLEQCPPALREGFLNIEGQPEDIDKGRYSEVLSKLKMEMQIWK